MVRHFDGHVMPAGQYHVGITYQGNKPITLTTLQQSSTRRQQPQPLILGRFKRGHRTPTTIAVNQKEKTCVCMCVHVCACVREKQRKEI